MKSLEFIFQETEIHFLVNPQDKNVMVNATEMAKVFGKDVREFLKLEGTKKFISAKLKKLNNEGDSPHYNEDFIFKTNKKAGTYMLRPLAMKFAAWLDPDFEVWVFDTIDDIVFGNYKKHWQAHARQEQAKVEMEGIKKEILTNPTPEKVAAYFEASENYKSAKSQKTWAIRNQLKLFTE